MISVGFGIGAFGIIFGLVVVGALKVAGRSYFKDEHVAPEVAQSVAPFDRATDEPRRPQNVGTHAGEANPAVIKISAHRNFVSKVQDQYAAPRGERLHS